MSLSESNEKPTYTPDGILVEFTLALFPGSRAWAEKKKKEPGWYTLFAHVQFSQDFWEFGNP